MAKRSLRLEPFEDRILLAIDGPQLLAAIPATGVVINQNTVLDQAPRDILLRFSSNIDVSTLTVNGTDSIQIRRSADNDWTDNDNVLIVPGYVGVEGNPNEVRVRFNENLPNAYYEMIISPTLKDTSGKAFNGGTALVRDFSLDLAPQVVAVVPQPISRGSNGKLTQSTNTIDVYFNNNDTLDTASAQNVNNYQLIRSGGGTSGTATTIDDVVIKPTSVSYSSASGKATLTFAAADLLTNGAYRLRVGTSEPLAVPVQTLTPSAAGSSFGSAANLDTNGSPFNSNLGTQTVTLTDVINSVPTPVVFPGSPLEPGERPTNIESHVNGTSNNGPIPVIEYNFKSVYGQLFGQDQYNTITPAQKDRIREVFAYYAYYLGVEFVETPSSGWTIATGDPRVLGATPNVGGVAGGNLAIMNSVQQWDNLSRGSYFNTAMHEIGHLLGLGHNYETPSVQGTGVEDGVFPGDLDLIYAEYLWPKLGNDINVYSFDLKTAGTLNVETIAERLKSLGLGSAPSQLDSVITLYDSTGKMLARNDDYYGNDSFVQMVLGAGKYYVAITSTGNTDFDPTVVNSGGGGTTAGGYQLRLSFTPTPGANDGIRDQTGNRLDGDFDGIAGGAYNFWFQVGSTIYVDKAATSGTGALGSITNPYTRIGDALASALPGTVVRIVGNGGADGQLGTVNDNLSYNVGFDSLGLPLSDGTKFEVPKGVTVMIDAGAIIKFRGANLNVGTIDVDRSSGALQVLGTTAVDSQGRDVGSVYLTSYFNRSIGTDAGLNYQGLTKGNWGGIVFRNDSDLEANGVFLNYVNQARISYGGGTVNVGGQLEVYRPITMESARPALTFNTITNSADSAMSATPNSFEESEVLGLGFQADYGRVGPKIYGNRLSQNSINGLFISIELSSSTFSVLDELTVSGRIASTDIVYVLTESLIINGNPGGYFKDDLGNLFSRPNGRLAIDPGTIFKLGGGRFETEIGAQFIAEGTLDRPIIFTSIYDDRYGAGGTSDTTNNGLSKLPSPGQWGGFLFGPTSTGSLDYALVTFAGGEMLFEGLTDAMNPVEIDQAQVRITNSTFEANFLPGSGPRNGRGAAEPAVIYIRGAQPVILNNVFQSNTGGTERGSVISVNLNSLNSDRVNDWGRSRGAIGLAGSYPTNYGPLIRNNLIGDNSLNGMVVRGGLLTTNGVWDDTDIVHIVYDTITLGNQQSLTGTLRMQSSPTESLVVKLLGTNTDIIAGGELLDIPDRTGGSLQIVGTPGHAVVLTSLKDDTVGAGLTPQGTPQRDTLNRKGVVDPVVPNLATSGPIIIDAAARDAHGTTNTFAWEMLRKEIQYVFDNSKIVNSSGAKPDKILVIGYDEDPTPDGSLSLPYSAESIKKLQSQGKLIGVQSVTFAWATNEILDELAKALNGEYAAIVVSSRTSYLSPSGRAEEFVNNTWFGGTTDFMTDTLNVHKNDIIKPYLDTLGGGMLVLAQDTAAHPYNFLDFDTRTSELILDKTGGNVMTATETGAIEFAKVDASDVFLNSGGPYRAAFEGPTNFGNFTPWAVDPVSGEIAMLGRSAGGPGLGLPRDIVSPADWGSIRLDTLSNDRNVEIINETEQSISTSGDANQTPATSQAIGELAKDAYSANEDIRLGFEIHGNLSQAANSPGGADVDVYSFRGTAGTLVWIDIDKTSTSLDTVVELVDINGAVIARSNNSVEETAGTPLVGTGRPLQLGDGNSIYSSPDFYTTNPKDAGMRVVLPAVGTSTVGTYFVRVRSNSETINNLTGGLTKGDYQLQIRLQEVDEYPGSTIRYADVRYGNNGIEVIGKPEQNPLVSNTAQTGLGNGTIDTAQDLGNLLEAGSNTIDVSGVLANATDVHWYKFSLNYEQVQSIAGLSDGMSTFAAMLQVNFADGLGRPDTTLSLYNQAGQLIMISRDGQIADSLPRPDIGGIGVDSGNLKHGSYGSLDPTMGPIELLAGSPKKRDAQGNIIPESVVTYYVAISSNQMLPAALSASYSAKDPANTLIRLEPTDSITRIIDDRVGFSGNGITTSSGSGQLFPTNSGTVRDRSIELNSYADEYHLGDVPLFVTTNQGIQQINPYTGALMTQEIPLEVLAGNGYYNIAMRQDGLLYALTYGGAGSNSIAATYVTLDTATGEATKVGDNNLKTTSIDLNTPRQPGTPFPTTDPTDKGFEYTALAYWQKDANSTERRLFAIAQRNEADLAGGVPYNILLELDPNTGDVLNPIPSEFNGLTVWKNIPSATELIGTNVIPAGVFRNVAQMTGIAFAGDTLYTITADGKLYSSSNALTPVGTGLAASEKATLNPLIKDLGISGVTSLSIGPQFVENGEYKTTLFAITDTGRVYAFDTSGNKRGVFLNGSWVLNLGLNLAPNEKVEGLAFSPFDFNLWHATLNRAEDLGHGISQTFNNNIDRDPAEADKLTLFGGASYYYGVEPIPSRDNDPDNVVGQPGSGSYATNSALDNTYAVPGGTSGSLTSETFDLSGYSALDKPTLYFNYYLDTGGVETNNSTTDALDSFRVFVSSDGAHWDLLATNNVTSGSNAENSAVATPSGGAYKNQPERQRVQQLYDNTLQPAELGGPEGAIAWRQARVDLGDWAGKSNLRLRFEFSTAGSMGSGNSLFGTGQVLTALAANQISSGETFEIDGQLFTFRLDSGNPETGSNVEITSGMTAEQVAIQMAKALDRIFVTGGVPDDPDLFSSVKVVGDELRLFGKSITNPGILPAFTGIQTGDNHGKFNNISRNRTGTKYEGVYIDDFVVGFASRGEMVTNSQPYLTGNPLNPFNPSAVAYSSIPKVSTDPDQILTGSYQLQIRPAQSYAFYADDHLYLQESFDVNDRFAQGITLVARPGSQISDGQYFTIDDGSQILKFEFDFNNVQSVTGSVVIKVLANDSAAQIAVKIRDAINGTVLGRGFKVRAATYPNGDRVDLFDAVEVGNAGPLASVKRFKSFGDTRPVAGNASPGQTIVQNSTVSYSRGVGIKVAPKMGQINLVRPGAFTYSLDEQMQFPVGTPGRSGSIATTQTSNPRGWTPGVTIRNNLVTHSGRTGIMIAGDPNASYAYSQGLADFAWGNENIQSIYRDVELFVPFVRVLNNTIYDAKVGIAAVNTSSPTILNNVVANVRVDDSTGMIRFKGAGAGIYVDPSSGTPKDLPKVTTAFGTSPNVTRFGTTVVSANLFQNNSKNVISDSPFPDGSLGIALAAGAPLFVNAAKDNFYLVAGSQAIDSSVDSLVDRAEMTAALGSLGFAPSPIVAPATDLLGQKRVDDASVDPPAGVGNNVFKDRGALERADFTGPTAQLLSPIDNDSQGNDKNSLPNQVTLVNALLTEFSIQLLDVNGVGIDPSTLSIDKVIITRTVGGVTTLLQPNLDYVLAYDTNSGVARLIPAQGLWINGKYEINLNNASNPIRDLAGNNLQPNTEPAGGQGALTRFVVELTDTIVSPWQNPIDKYDVDNNGRVNTQDMLWLINRILQNGGGFQLPTVATAPPYLDVSGDGRLNATDVTLVINQILRLRAAASATPQTAAATDAPTTTPLVEATVEPLAMVDDTSTEESGASADSNAQVASGLVMSSNVSQPEEAAVEISAASPTAGSSPQAVDKVIYADAPLAAEEEVGVNRWDSELDGILNDLGGDLQERLFV